MIDAFSFRTQLLIYRPVGLTSTASSSLLMKEWKINREKEGQREKQSLIQETEMFRFISSVFFFFFFFFFTALSEKIKPKSNLKNRFLLRYQLNLSVRGRCGPRNYFIDWTNKRCKC